MYFWFVRGFRVAFFCYGMDLGASTTVLSSCHVVRYSCTSDVKDKIFRRTNPKYLLPSSYLPLASVFENSVGVVARASRLTGVDKDRPQPRGQRVRQAAPRFWPSVTLEL